MSDAAFMPAAMPDRRITQFAFRTRVGDTLVAQMELAVMANPADDGLVQFAKAVQRAKMARTFSAEYIDLDNQELRDGFAAVPQVDFDRIFNTPVSDAERP